MFPSQSATSPQSWHSNHGSGENERAAQYDDDEREAETATRFSCLFFSLLR